MKVVAIIQARLGSTRLPGKVLLNIGGLPCIKHSLDFCKSLVEVDEVVVATTLQPEDDELCSYLEDQNIHFYRGSTENVLSRYFYCARQYNAAVILRITADDPIKDRAIAEKIINFHKNNFAKFDYVSNNLKPSFPEGHDIETFTFSALEKAYSNAKKESEKEHVTPYIWKNPNLFNLYNFESTVDYSDLRLTLDEIGDYYFLCKLVNPYFAINFL